MVSMCSYAQDQKVADSLRAIYEEQALPDTAKFELLLDLSFNETRDLERGLKYAEDLIKLSQQSGNDRYLRAGYFLKGTKLRLLTRLDDALDAFFKSADLAEKLHDNLAEGDAYGAIAATYSTAKNHSNAILYYNKSIAVLRRSNDSISLASALSNAGDEFRNVKEYDSALLYFRESKTIFDKIR